MTSLLEWPRSILPFTAHQRAVEEKAAAHLMLACERMNVRDVPLPVPVEEWIELAFGFEFGEEDFRKQYGVDALGGCWPPREDNGHRGRIAIDCRLSHSGRRRFTCAHELGHMMLHAKVRREFIDQYIEQQLGSDRHERQANQFATGFLMPAMLVKKELLAALSETTLGASGGMHCAHTMSEHSLTLWREELVPQLTKKFDVSVQAMLRRLTELYLTDREPIMPLAVREHIETDTDKGGERSAKPRVRRPN